MDGDTISYVGEPGARRDANEAVPYLVLAMETQRPLAPAARFSLAGVDEVVIGRGPERAHKRFRDGDKGFLRIFVPDAWMSGEHARIVRSGDSWMVADANSKNGTFVRGARIQEARLSHADLVEAGSTIFLFRARAKAALKDPPDLSRSDFVDSPRALATLSPSLRREFDMLPRISGSTVPVLVLGETGTGKEVIARTIHELSGRTGPFKAVNCGALPDTLIESELFGSKKGAFSGATEDRIGLVRASHGGTLFLDEIAELPEPSQAALLRVLQESEVVPVGGTEPVKVDIRVLAATHQNLSARVEAGTFRKDLYSRLIGFQLTLPPLRERREDIGLLVAELLPRVAPEVADKVRFQRAAGRALFTFDWPLNIRELEHALSSSIALAGGNEITPDHLPESLRVKKSVTPSSSRVRLSPEDEQIRAELVDLLERHAGNISAVARDMGKERVQIRRWCKRFEIDVTSYRD